MRKLIYSGSNEEIRIGDVVKPSFKEVPLKIIEIHPYKNMVSVEHENGLKREVSPHVFSAEYIECPDSVEGQDNIKTNTRGYENLLVWQKSIELVKEVYFITKKFPKDEQYGLTTQLRRSAVSVPSNIAEGCARNSKGEFLQFLGVASGSLAEAKTQMIVASEVGIIKKDDCDKIFDLAEQIAKMLSSLKQKLKTKD